MTNSWFKSPEIVDQDRKESLKNQLEFQRKEAESEGVVINDVRYSGNPSNRQALLEVVQFAREAGISYFESWKDSDGNFHSNHPLSDVEQASQAIAHKRGQLIALEASYQNDIDSGTLTDLSKISW